MNFGAKKQTDLKIGIQEGIGGKLIHLYSNIFMLPERLLNALIIEWFDSVGIYICIKPFKEFSKDVYFDVHLDFELYGVWSSRQEATEKGIIKANEIYNNIK